MTQAQNAKIAAEKASILENLDTELAAYNIDTITGDPQNIVEMFNNLRTKGVIDKILWSDNNYKADEIRIASDIRGIPNFETGSSDYTMDYSVEKDQYKIKITADKNGIYKSEFGEVNLSSGGSVAAGTTLVTENAFSGSSGSGGSGGTKDPNEGKFTIEKDGASIMFVDPIGTEPLEDGSIPELSIYVPAGKTANIYVFEDMVLTNENVDRSAIDIDPTATLNLWIKEGATVTVNSGFGKAGADTVQGKESQGGPGGYAGIHCWKATADTNNTDWEIDDYSTLNISGKGSIECFGGNAGTGGRPSGTYDGTGGAGGGGAGAGIGGNGGKGGNGMLQSEVFATHTGSISNPFPGETLKCCGHAGEDCGKVTIKDATVKAVGGDSRFNISTNIYEL